MNEISNTLSESQLPVRRTNSCSAVSSSVAAADIMNQYTNLSRYLSQKPAIEIDKQNQMKFENNENIQITYNYYNNTSSDGI